MLAGRTESTPASAARTPIPEGAVATKRQVRVVIGTMTPGVVALIDAKEESIRRRAAQLATAAAKTGATTAIDLSTLAVRILPAEMRLAQAVVDEGLRAIKKMMRSRSAKRLRKLALQLVLSATHDAAAALTGTTRWPRAWVGENALERPSTNGRPKLQNQIDLLTARAASERWPKADEPLALLAAEQRAKRKKSRAGANTQRLGCSA